VVRACSILRTMGFELGTPVGNSVSITGPVHLFQSTFKTRLQPSKSSGIKFASGKAGSDYQLPTENIPSSLKEHVLAVTFSPPPDFGPTDFSNPN
jgi:hypothetical protein